MLGPLLSPSSATKTNFNQTALMPSLAHPLGTDQFGREVFVRMLVASRISLSAALLAALLATIPVLALLLVVMFAPEWSEQFIARTFSIFLAVPSMIVALLVVALIGTGVWQTAFAIGFSLQPVYYHMLRPILMPLTSEVFVKNALSRGASVTYISRWHIFPAVRSTLLGYALILFVYAVLGLAGLSFLGIVGSPSLPTLGIMFNEGRQQFFDAPWVAFSVGGWFTFVILSLVTAANAFDQKIPLN